MSVWLQADRGLSFFQWGQTPERSLPEATFYTEEHFFVHHRALHTIKVWKKKLLALGDGDLGISTTVITFDYNELVIVVAQIHAIVLPHIEVSASADCTTGGPAKVLLGVANRPKLLEGLGTIDGRLIDASHLENVVACAVTNNSTLHHCSGRWVM